MERQRAGRKITINPASDNAADIINAKGSIGSSKPVGAPDDCRMYRSGRDSQVQHGTTNLMFICKVYVLLLVDWDLIPDNLFSVPATADGEVRFSCYR